MKKAGADITSYFSPTKRSNLSQDTSEAQITPDVSVATASSAAEASVLDIAGVVSCGATSDCNKLKLIRFRTPAANVPMPSRQYNDKTRTCGVRQRFCSRDWFEKFQFISFSSSACGIFCLACVLFPVEQQTSGRAQVLVTLPLVNWKDAVADMTTHSRLEYHLTSEAKMDAFLRTMEHPSERIDMSLSTAMQERVQKNRAVITSIVKCLELCGRQGIALRGHRDDNTSTDLLYQGKFKAVVNFRVESGDIVLQEHLKSCSSRETYISKTTQNVLIHCMGDFIRDQIVADIIKSKFFSVSADEVTDVSNWEQLGIVFRYVKDGEAVEKLVGFVACESVRGEDIFREIKAFIANCGLDIKMCRGQGYDGAGAMAGALKGCQARLKAEVPQAVYYHCSSHQLNLAISKACSVPEIQRMISSLKALGVFFKYSPKRQRKLESSVKHVNEERQVHNKLQISKTKFKLLCETRWVERHTAMEDFHHLYESLVMCLTEISHPPHCATEDKVKWDAKSTTEASGLLKDICSSEFLISFYICRYFFGFTKDVAKQLQGTSKDVLSACDDIFSTISCINAARADG